MAQIMSDLLFCKYCETEKPPTEMRKDSSYATGYRPQCLACKARVEGKRTTRPSAKKKAAKPKKVPFEDRLYPCSKCKRDDIPFSEMTKDKRKFAGVGSICLPCRRKRDAELDQERREREAAQERQREEEAKRKLSGDDWEYCFKCNSRSRPGVLRQPPAIVASGYPDDALLCSRCVGSVHSREEQIRMERAKHSLPEHPTMKQLESAARVSALRQLAIVHEDEYRDMLRHFRDLLGVGGEKRWITL